MTPPPRLTKLLLKYEFEQTVGASIPDEQRATAWTAFVHDARGIDRISAVALSTWSNPYEPVRDLRRALLSAYELWRLADNAHSVSALQGPGSPALLAYANVAHDEFLELCQRALVQIAANPEHVGAWSHSPGYFAMLEHLRVYSHFPKTTEPPWSDSAPRT